MRGEAEARRRRDRGLCRFTAYWCEGWQRFLAFVCRLCKMEEELLNLDSDSDCEFNNLVSLFSLSKKRKKSFWKSDYMKRRSSHGEFVLTSELPDGSFSEFFRLNKLQFDEIHSIIKNDISGKECNAQQPIGSQEKLTICLRYLATGDMFKTIAMSYRMGERTVSKIVSEVCDALWLRLKPKYMPEPTVDMWKNIAMDYEKKWQFYNCLGSLDGKHVTIRKPLLSGSSFFSYKQHYFSTVLMGLADANYRFTFIDVGSMGRFPDSSVFSNSYLGKQLFSGSLELPTPKPLPGQTCDSPYVFVADEAFPLTPNIMRPYPKAKVTNNFENKVFNYRLSRARQTIECAFGILSSRFRVYKRPFECKLETVDKVVMATCVLHNYLRTQKLMVITGTGQDDDDIIDPPSENQLLPLARSRVRCTNVAFLTRQNFTKCFNSPGGSVEWQRKAVSRGKY